MIARRRILANGIVQGVGFRPWIFRLAARERLAGFVTNTSAGVVIEVQGPPATLDRFAAALRQDPPRLARIVSLDTVPLPVEPACDRFEIRASRDDPGTATWIPPEAAVCADCLREIRDPADRRHGYPFTNCTHCGPRWTIIRRIPYDRPFTSMAPFALCARCRAEYDDPADRRFHAQPNACPDCGPRCRLEAAGRPGAELPGDPLAAAADRLAAGLIVAVQGLGGFHLAVRADDEAAVRRLRERKRREAKPLAVMAADLTAARALARITADEAAALCGPEAPIVLLERLPDAGLAAGVAPGHRRLGLLLPYTPLHHLLLDALAPHGVRALVMTSGNLGDEPICLNPPDARARLADIADFLLIHDREIVRRADDSVLQVLSDGPLFFRRGRGFAPVPVPCDLPPDHPPVLAVGPQLKNTVCLLKDGRAFLSPHVGDLENLATYEFFRETVATLQDVLECEPRIIACDLHPDYLGTRWAREREAAGALVIPVQHHHAHLVAVLAEHGLSGPALGIVLDGTGYGEDGTIWGGEILAGDAAGFRRLAHLETLRLPGGEAAVRAPWRTAVAALHRACGPDLPRLPALAGRPVGRIVDLLEHGLNSPATSSCGRLFDAVAALCGPWGEIRYEAQAAIELTALVDADQVAAARPWPCTLPPDSEGPLALPTGPLIRGVVADLLAGADAAAISARFHRTLIDLLAGAAVRAARTAGLSTVVLAGGVFQNDLLLGGLTAALSRAGLHPLRPVQLPPNDGAVALGQAVVAVRRALADQSA